MPSTSTYTITAKDTAAQQLLQMLVIAAMVEGLLLALTKSVLALMYS